MKCGNLILLENSGPVQASTGIALPCFTLLLRSCPTAEPPVRQGEVVKLRREVKDKTYFQVFVKLCIILCLLLFSSKYCCRNVAYSCS